MKWRLNKDSKIIVPGSETSNWYIFNGHSFEQITPAVNGANLEFTVSKNKAVISLIRTNFDVLDTTQRYGKIKSERILSNLKISNNINAHRVTGDNLLTDGSFEEWTSATDLTHWNELIAEDSTVNQESTDVVDGSYAVRLDIDANNTAAAVRQQLTLEPGVYRFTVWGKIGASGYSYRMLIKDVDNILYWHPTKQAWVSSFTALSKSNTDWEQSEIIFKVNTAGTYEVRLLSSNSASQSIYFDNAKLEKIGVIEQYDVRGGLKVVSDGTSVKKYAIDSQSSNQAELEKVWM